MDGTLIDSEELWLAAEIELMSKFGVVWTNEDQAICIGGPMKRVEHYLAQRAGNVRPPEYFGETLNSLMIEKFHSHVNYAPGAFNLLSELLSHKVPLALVTASSRSIVNAAMETIGKATFSVVISGDDVALGKPNPEGYLKAAEALGVPITECIILEDSKVGITAAVASGAVVIGIAPGGALFDSDEITQILDLTNVTADRLAQIFHQRKGLHQRRGNKL